LLFCFRSPGIGTPAASPTPSALSIADIRQDWLQDHPGDRAGADLAVGDYQLCCAGASRRRGNLNLNKRVIREISV
jgi:hypothetical protein